MGTIWEGFLYGIRQYDLVGIIVERFGQRINKLRGSKG